MNKQLLSKVSSKHFHANKKASFSPLDEPPLLLLFSTLRLKKPATENAIPTRS